jgi:gamma-glutamyltranspeptidase/glutathione hydrolase
MSRREGVEIVCDVGAVAAGPAEAARAGAEILERGGNAFDAAAAACLACAMLEPQAVDLGGYALAAVVREGSTGRVWSVDANTVAPAAATSDMFQTLPVGPGRPTVNELEYGCSVADQANFYGPLAVSVPGFLGGVGTMWERWGRLRWSEIVQPSRRLVENGIPYSLVAKDVEFKREPILRYPSTTELLLPNGPSQTTPDEHIWLRPELVQTLDRLADAGWRDFYSGDIGRAIADFVLAEGGILTRSDMAGFEPRITEPCSRPYHGAEVYTAIPPNGGFSVLDALAVLEPQTLPSYADAHFWELMANVLVRTWTSRLNDSPICGGSDHGTAHVSAADNSGNLVSATITQGGLFGSCLAVPGTGIILGHGMCRFDPHPGLSNSPGPKKRPLNNLCPLLIRMKDRDIAIGTRGGRKIVSVAAQMAQRIIDREATVYEAAVAPRMHTVLGTPLELSSNFDPAIREELERAGYRTEIPDEVAGAAHGAELLHAEGKIRAGGNIWAAGI